MDMVKNIFQPSSIVTRIVFLAHISISFLFGHLAHFQIKINQSFNSQLSLTLFAEFWSLKGNDLERILWITYKSIFIFFIPFNWKSSALNDVHQYKKLFQSYFSFGNPFVIFFGFLSPFLHLFLERILTMATKSWKFH